MPDFFPGFEQRQIETTGATINLVTGGGGPALLLLHGYPQTHVMWRKVAPGLAQDFTVVVPDLRGYGDSSKPPAGENFINYSKRALALDQVEVMAALGHDRFAVAGHDRGARVTHRLLRDHPDKITRGATLDIVPTKRRQVWGEHLRRRSQARPGTPNPVQFYRRSGSIRCHLARARLTGSDVGPGRFAFRAIIGPARWRCAVGREGCERSSARGGRSGAALHARPGPR